MGFFSVDGALYKFMQRLWDLFKINFLWLIFSIPIITFGGATIAAFDVTMKMVDEREGYVAHQFVKSFKANFKNGIWLGILFLFCIYVVWLDFSLFNQIDGNPIILLIMGMVSAFIFVMAFLYAFPLQARYENTWFNTLKNSVDVATRYFLRTLALIFILCLEIALIFWNEVTMFIGFILGPACIILTISGFARYFFRMLEKEPGTVKNPEKSRED